MPGMKADRVKIHFTRSLPVNELEVAQTADKLRGLVEDDRLIEHVGKAIGI